MNSTRSKAKAFSVADIPELVFGLGIGAVIAAIMLLVMVNLQNSNGVAICPLGGTFNGVQCSNYNSIIGTGNVPGGATYNALGNGITGVGNVLAQYPLIGTVAGLTILLGFVVYAFYKRSQKEGL